MRYDIERGRGVEGTLIAGIPNVEPGSSHSWNAGEFPILWNWSHDEESEWSRALWLKTGPSG
jgi:hypothetical protein